MKKFFEEYGGVAVLVIVIAVLLLIVGSVKALDESTGKVKGSGVAGLIGNKLSDSLSKFQQSFNNVASGSGSGNNGSSGNGGSDGSSSTPATGPNGETLISKTESQIGKYADIDGDGTVDGIIFADLLFGGNESWGGGRYTIPTISSCKEYYVSQSSYTNVLNGTAEVISPTEKDNNNSRFYVMSLNNLNSQKYSWYVYADYYKMSDYEATTSEDFGKGELNTKTLLQKAEEQAYGQLTTNDIWNNIQEKVNEGWFVPSKDEIKAFANNLNIKYTNYDAKGLPGQLWSSSQASDTTSWSIYLSSESVRNDAVGTMSSVRLACTY